MDLIVAVKCSYTPQQNDWIYRQIKYATLNMITHHASTVRHSDCHLCWCRKYVRTVVILSAVILIVGAFLVRLVLLVNAKNYIQKSFIKWSVSCHH